MKTFYVYSPDDEYLGKLDATDYDTARQFAASSYAQPHLVLTYALTYNRKIAA